MQSVHNSCYNIQDMCRSAKKPRARFFTCEKVNESRFISIEIDHPGPPSPK